MRMLATVTLEGKLGSGLGRMRLRVGRKVEQGLLAVGRTLLHHSQPLVPKDTLALVDSGRVSRIGSLTRTVVVVGYGGKDFPPRTEYSKKEKRVVTRRPHVYTVFVHEAKYMAHDVGRAGFLSEPLRTRLSEMRMALLTALRTV